MRPAVWETSEKRAGGKVDVVEFVAVAPTLRRRLQGETVAS